MTDFEEKMNDFLRSDQPKKSIKSKGRKPSEYYITSPLNGKIYAWPPMYYNLFKDGDETSLVEEGKIPTYFIEITEDNCEILDGAINPKLISLP